MEKIFHMVKAFISYSWDNTDHKNWVCELATRLRKDGIDIILDQWHLVPGDQIPEFMERAVRESDFVLIVCTHKYKERSNNRQGGVGYEGDIMTSEVMNIRNQRKFIPILRQQSWNDSAPNWLLGKYYIDFSSSPYLQKNYDDLINTLLGTREKPPSVGTINDEKTSAGIGFSNPKVSTREKLYFTAYEAPGTAISYPSLWSLELNNPGQIIKVLDYVSGPFKIKKGKCFYFHWDGNTTLGVIDLFFRTKYEIYKTQEYIGWLDVDQKGSSILLGYESSRLELISLLEPNRIQDKRILLLGFERGKDYYGSEMFNHDDTLISLLRGERYAKKGYIFEWKDKSLVSTPLWVSDEQLSSISWAKTSNTFITISNVVGKGIGQVSLCYVRQKEIRVIPLNISAYYHAIISHDEHLLATDWAIYDISNPMIPKLLYEFNSKREQVFGMDWSINNELIIGKYYQGSHKQTFVRIDPFNKIAIPFELPGRLNEALSEFHII
jgi:hypothetical protein